jgi:hypothetical protein
MPFRHFPNSINSRLEVLQKTFTRASSASADEMAISADTKKLLDAEFPTFSKEVDERSQSFSNQAEATRVEQQLQRLLRQEISHFVQGFNFGVERGVFKASSRLDYKLDQNSSLVPALDSETETVMWAKNMINGEAIRLSGNTKKKTSNNEIPMCNPTAAKIEITLAEFMKESNKQSELKEVFFNENKDVLDMLPQIDLLIKDIYDEVGFYYRRLEPSQRRRLSREWGVIYYTSSTEQPEDGCITEEELQKM